jgi:hypothetical protein
MANVQDQPVSITVGVQEATSSARVALLPAINLSGEKDVK